MANVPKHLQKKLSALPKSPGVYLMRNHQKKVIYVGKAKSLYARVRSYFSGSDTRAFVSHLEHQLADLDVVLTSNEKEALLVENEMIKRYKPMFNVELKDDKRYLCLRLDLKKAFPRIEVTRRIKKDGARYFGPYHSASSIRESLRTINRHFQLRTCSDQMMKQRQRPCLQYQIKRCPAPCVFELPKGSYDRNVSDVVKFLEGDHHALLLSLKEKMVEFSTHYEYEMAAGVRDQIRALEKSQETQRVVSTDMLDRDVVGIYREADEVEIHLTQIRAGRLIDAERFSFSKTTLPDAEVLQNFIRAYYLQKTEQQHLKLPTEILLPKATGWDTQLSELLTEIQKRRVKVYHPQRGEKVRMLDMAMRNAEQAFKDKARAAGAAKTAAEALKRKLHLSRLPHSIECFDISHHQGEAVVASCVRLEGGVPNKDLYRRYKIKTVSGNDDFASMYEVISRRIKRGLEEGDFPDLIVVDGGKGQLSSARAAMQDVGFDAIEIVSLAKARGDKHGGQHIRNQERIFVLGHKDPIVLKQNAPALFLLMRARDEAHRFAIEYQRKLKRKARKRSVLDDIPGIGPKKRQALLKAFSSVQGVQEASDDAVRALVGEKLRVKIREFFEQDKGQISL